MAPKKKRIFQGVQKPKVQDFILFSGWHKKGFCLLQKWAALQGLTQGVWTYYIFPHGLVREELKEFHWQDIFFFVAPIKSMSYSEQESSKSLLMQTYGPNISHTAKHASMNITWQTSVI